MNKNNNLLSALLNEPALVQSLFSLIGTHEASSAPAVQSSPELSASSDPTQELICRLISILTSFSQSSQAACDPDRICLLTALKPFLDPSAAAQIDRAIHLISAAGIIRHSLRQLAGDPTSAQGGDLHVQQLSKPISD